MFSDRYRTIKIAGLIILLVLLAWYADSAQDVLTLEECLSDPELHEGKEVPIFMEARIIRITPDSLRVSQPDGPLDVVIPPGFKGMFPPGALLEDVRPGQSLEAVTIFRLPGYLELKQFRSAHLRKYKIAISIIPAVITGIFLILYLRWENGRLVIKE